MNIIGYLKDRYDPGMTHGLIIGFIIGVIVAIPLYELGRGVYLPELAIEREASRPSRNPGRQVSWFAANVTREGFDIAAYTDEQLADAIKVREGKNKRGFYGYGIQVYCSSEKVARAACLDTIWDARRNFKMHDREEPYGYLDKLEYLAMYYCPLDDPKDKRGLNEFWLPGVKSYLGKKGRR